MESVLVLMLFAGFLGALLFIVLIGLGSTPNHQTCWQPVPASPVPFRRRNFLFSSAERSFYKVLRRLVPDHMIFIKVRLADLVESKPNDHSFWKYFSPINRKQIDFVVCDPTLAPVVAIELADVLHCINEQYAGDEIVNSALASASLPMVRIPQRKTYLLDDLRGLLSPYLRVRAPMI